MSTISLPGTKALVFDLIVNEDSMTEEGKIQKRTLFKKEFLRDFRSLKNKLLQSVEIGWVSADAIPKMLKFEDANWTKFAEWKEDPSKKALTERWTSDALELSEGEKKAVKYFYNERELVNEIAEDVWAEFEQAILN